MTLRCALPPIDLQNQFAAIVEKVEGLKSRYQQSLTDLESLYGALSQKAFKGELDLSRVILPTEETNHHVDKRHKTKVAEVPAKAEDVANALFPKGCGRPGFVSTQEEV